MTTKTTVILELARNEPGLRRAEVAKRVGVSREFIRQLDERYGLPFRRGHQNKMPRPPCIYCGEPVIGSRRERPCHRRCTWVTLTCSVCKKPFQRRRGQTQARANDRRYKGRAVCSESCLRDFRLYLASRMREARTK